MCASGEADRRGCRRRPPLTRNQLRRAPQASAARRWALLEGVAGEVRRRRRSPRSRPGCRSRAPAARSPRAGPDRPLAPLVPRDVEAAGIAVVVGDQRVEVGSVRLWSPAGLAATRRQATPASCAVARARLLPSTAVPWATTTALEPRYPDPRGRAAPHDRATRRSAAALSCSSCDLNGLFVAAEFALVRTRRSRLETLAKKGEAGVDEVFEQLERIDEVLSACQVGITMASIGIGFLGEPALASLIEPLFGGLSDGVAVGHLDRDRVHARDRRSTSRSASRCRRCSRSRGPRPRRGCWPGRSTGSGR